MNQRCKTMIYKDIKVTLFTKLCEHYENNNKNFYNILDNIVQILEDKQISNLIEILNKDIKKGANND